ncbi:hypothetical protein KFL_013740015, partial [Klebsormidium nitens]
TRAQGNGEPSDHPGERIILRNLEDPFATGLITPTWKTSCANRKKGPQWNKLKDNELHGYLNYCAHAVLEYMRASKKQGVDARTTALYQFVYQALARVGIDLLELFCQRREQREPGSDQTSPRWSGCRAGQKPMDSEELVTVGPNPPDQELNRGRIGKCGGAFKMPIDRWGAQAAETYGTALITEFLKKKKRKLLETPAFVTRYKLVGHKPTAREGMGELAHPRSKPLGRCCGRRRLQQRHN